MIYTPTDHKTSVGVFFDTVFPLIASKYFYFVTHDMIRFNHQ